MVDEEPFVLLADCSIGLSRSRVRFEEAANAIVCDFLTEHISSPFLDAPIANVRRGSNILTAGERCS